MNVVFQWNIVILSSLVFLILLPKRKEGTMTESDCQRLW